MSLTRDLIADDIKLVLIDQKNMQVYINLARSYEAEFSSLTHKVPNDEGIFEPDTIPLNPYVGYLLYKSKTPIGFCVAELSNEMYDVAEFYIIPSMRKNKFGYHMATSVFDKHAGSWQVRQIEGAENAKAFWRKIISQYTGNEYVEAVVNDEDWGVVTRQRFASTALRSQENKQVLLSDLLSPRKIK